MVEPADSEAHDGDSPRVVSPSTRVSVAFPFSKITVNEPTEMVVELARLVQRLAQSVAQGDEGAAVSIASDASDLVARLEGARAS